MDAEGGRTRGTRLLVLLGVVALLASCATSQEAGDAVLLSSVVVVPASAGVLWLLLLLWRRRHPDLRPRWRSTLYVYDLVLICVGLIVLRETSGKWLGYALWWFGTSYLAVLLVVWRVWFFYEKEASFRRAPVVAACVFLVPAVFLSFAAPPNEGLPDMWLYLFFWPGYQGAIAGPILAILLIEAWRRGRRGSPRGC